MKPSIQTILLFLFSYACLLAHQQLSLAVDTITANQSLKNGETLVSSGRNFELGFFRPSNSDKRYVGIWYSLERVSVRTVVWVANRNASLNNTSGQLNLTDSGNLILVDGTDNLVWSSNTSTTAQSPILQLLDSGNLVVRNESDPNNFLWQSFDHPGDTLLQGMKVGRSFVTGQEISLSSWKTNDDPAPGDHTYHCDPTGYPQLTITGRSGRKEYRSGPWSHTESRFRGTSSPRANVIYTYELVFNENEVYYQPENYSVISRAILNPNGVFYRYTWMDETNEWAEYLRLPSDLCDTYALCGPYGTCNLNRVPVCTCLNKFVTRNETAWNRTDWTHGCMRRTPFDCQNGDGFIRYSNIKLPDVQYSRYNESRNLKECRDLCIQDCTCMAYSNIDERGGCFLWYRDLLDIRDLAAGGQDIYIRMASSELDNDQKPWLVAVIVISILLGMLGFSVSTWCLIRRRKEKRGSENNKEDIELPLYDLPTIAAATNNFSSTNMIGKGGFGTVYKGTLSTGQEIAVKRLSKNSGQGLGELKNEIALISKLQHRNLVRLLGCCLEGGEMLLIYEYMPNESLNYFIFDQERKTSLTWNTRFEIAMGIAKGLLYLHQDSRLRIIHRDLKASNVLLDIELNPKISDFGIAKSFLGDQIESKTRHVIGTYGYMSPEYAVDGKYSVKSDVFSFGVLLLEIVSGKRTTSFHHPDHHHSLLGHAWLLWNKGEALELLDACLKESCTESQVMRFIQVGLLCLQKFPKDRPTMSAVVMMLGSEDVILPQPKEPGFFIERGSIDTSVSLNEEGFSKGNGTTITVVEAR